MRVMRLSVRRKGQTEEAQNFEFDQETVTVGRDSCNDLQLPSNAVSSSHAEIKKENNGYFIIDLGSKNGVYMDDIKLVPFQKTELKPHVKIGIAHYDIEFTIRGYSNASQLEHFHPKPAVTIVEDFTDDRAILDNSDRFKHKEESSFAESPMSLKELLDKNIQEISNIKKKDTESVPDIGSMLGGMKSLPRIFLYYLIAFLAVALGMILVIMSRKLG